MLKNVFRLKNLRQMRRLEKMLKADSDLLGSRDAYQVYRMKSSVWISPWLEMKYLPWKLICHHFSSLNFWTLRAVREISTVATDIPVFPAEKREVLVKY